MRLINYALPVLLLTMASGCASHTRLQVLQPADVMVPAHIQTIGVIDRSRVNTAGQGVLGVLEGALTGEAIGADSEGRTEAVRGSVDGLAGSPRFDVVQPAISKGMAQSSFFDETIDWKRAQKICKQAGCDALLALEAFDSDSDYRHSTRVEEREDDQGRVIKKVVHRADRETNVIAAWRLYDVSGRVITDDIRDMSIANTWTEEADSERAALAQLPSQYDTVRLLGYDSGRAYAARIAPTWITVSRSYYGSGSALLKQAKSHVKAGDWDGASKIWLEAAKSTDPKEKGRAQFNLALAAEVGGYLNRAAEWAQQAAITLNNNRARNYAATLRQRIADASRLDEQMDAIQP